MPQKDNKKCWEFFNCPTKVKGNCPAYEHNMGEECWYIIDIDKGCKGAGEKNTCFDCDWYKQLNPTSK